MVALDFCNKNVTFVMCISITSWDTLARGAGYGNGTGLQKFK